MDETAESGNPAEPHPSVHGSSFSSRMTVPTAQTDAMLKISQDMARVLERLTTPRAPIDILKKHGAEEIVGTTLEETEKAEFWLEKIQRVLEEINCPHDQMVSCVVSLLQGAAYDWWKLVLKHPQLPNPLTREFFVQSSIRNLLQKLIRKSSGSNF